MIFRKVRYLIPQTPSLIKYAFLLKSIWDDKYLTNGGKQFYLFKKELSKFLDIPYLSICSSGTVAEECLLNLIKTTGKSEVITTPYSFISTANAIVRCGLKPVFIDLDSDFSIDLNQLEESINERTLAILPVDVYGIPNKLFEIRKLIANRDIKLICDKSHSFGVKIGSNSSMSEGDFSFASMHATKVMSSIEGGLIFSSNQELISNFESYCNFGFKDHDALSFGTNAKIDELRCLFGRLVLASFNKRRDNRKKIYNKYKKFGLTRYIPKSLKSFEEANLWNYSYLPVLIPSEMREMIYQELLSKGIETKKYFEKLIPDYTAYKLNNNLWTANSSLKISREISRSVLTLPLYSELSTQTIIKIVNCLNKLEYKDIDYINNLL